MAYIIIQNYKLNGNNKSIFGYEYRSLITLETLEAIKVIQKQVENTYKIKYYTDPKIIDILTDLHHKESLFNTSYTEIKNPVYDLLEIFCRDYIPKIFKPEKIKNLQLRLNIEYLVARCYNAKGKDIFDSFLDTLEYIDRISNIPSDLNNDMKSIIEEYIITYTNGYDLTIPISNKEHIILSLEDEHYIDEEEYIILKLKDQYSEIIKYLNMFIKGNNLKDDDIIYVSKFSL